MIKQQRRNKLEEFFLKGKSGEVSNLADKFNVSKKTIRRDLEYLEKKGIIKRKYGGAILIENNKNTKISDINTRKVENSKEKFSIAKEAIKFIEGNKTILLDSGTTTESIAKQLHDIDSRKYISIVTNGLNVANECSKSEEIDVYLLGGKLRKKTLSIAGAQTIEDIKNFTIDIAFIGTTGISLKNGFTSSHVQEAIVKKNMASISNKVVVVADHTKFDKYMFKKFCGFEDIDTLITSNLVCGSVLNEIKEYGVEVILCDYEE